MSETGLVVIRNWLTSKGHTPFAYQEETWQRIREGRSGLVNAPTGYGKTFSVFLGMLIGFIDRHPHDYRERTQNGLQLLWITPLRALAKDIGRAMQEVIRELGMNWEVGIRNGDTASAERIRQKKRMPEVLIITPESLHLLLAQKDQAAPFRTLRIIAVDEWHELLGSKRGVQVELALSRLLHMARLHTDPCRVWGISATIGNLQEACEVLMAPTGSPGVIVKAGLEKRTRVESIYPEAIEKYPWAGHLGIRLAGKVLPVIQESQTSLIFINTRGMSETWYQTLLDVGPELAGSIALHHGSIDRELRTWIEDNLHTGNLKAVVCTASLDLGVDFRPVESVVQVGSPKGVARFLQRAGRSGHQPDAVSRIHFLPTHSLELLEAAALKSALAENHVEDREPLLLCYDVLLQYLCTLAVSDGFLPERILPEIRTTYCFRDLSDDEWRELLHFITEGGQALSQYDDYRKVEVEGDGRHVIRSRKVAMRHRLHIGTIVSDSMMNVRLIGGSTLGVIEEYFISRLEPGDVFTLAGRNLELVMIKDMTALVRRSQKKKSIVPSWTGGRMPLSAHLGRKLREALDRAATGMTGPDDVELTVLAPLLDLQRQLSHVPGTNELLIEHIHTDDGHHLFVYPFEGRLVHEAMAAILAYRISRIRPITFSFAMNDYGFELLSDQPIPLDDTNVHELFSPDNLLADIQRSVNSTEMARRKFRDIAVIGGLIFQGMPGERKKARHLQSSASLLFNVFTEYDPDHLLLRQAYREVFDQQMEEARLRDMLQRIQSAKIIITAPERLTPFCFPIKVDSMREDLSSEKLEDRVRRMQADLRAD
jgi:ATP-dependent Lhr-like helicase